MPRAPTWRSTEAPASGVPPSSKGRQLREVFRNGQTTTLAMHPELVGAALLCAMTADRPAAAR